MQKTDYYATLFLNGVQASAGGFILGGTLAKIKRQGLTLRNVELCSLSILLITTLDLNKKEIYPNIFVASASALAGIIKDRYAQ